MNNNRIYKISDVVKNEFLRFPIALLANGKYREMSLEAKFVYALLLNRLTLSQRNNWINENNEVFLIYTREEIAETLNITYKKAIAAFKELTKHDLIYQKRQGRGYPNLIFVMKPELSENEALAYEVQENPNNPQEDTDSNGTCQYDSSRHSKSAVLDMSCRNDMMFPTGRFKHDNTAAQDIPIPQASKIESIKPDSKNIEFNYIDRSVTVKDGQAQTSENDELEQILNHCGLDMFNSDVEIIFRSAIVRLYYSKEFRIGYAFLPQKTIQEYLRLISPEILLRTYEALKDNERQVKNKTAYIMVTLLNSITEEKSSLLIDLPPELVDGSDYFAQDESPEGFD